MNGIDSNLGFETVNDEKVSKNALIEKTDVKYTNGNLVITIASVVAIIGIATIAVKAKKQNA